MPMKTLIPCLTGAVALSFFQVAGAQIPDPNVGDSPPPLVLQNTVQMPPGAKVDWSALKGKVVVLEFWATWCAPCVASIPHLNELADRFKDQPVQFIALSDEDEKVVGAFLKRKPIHAWIGLDAGKATFKAYRITTIPHTVIVDRNGKIAAITYPASLTDTVLEDALAGRKIALAQPAPDGRDSLLKGAAPDGGDQGQPALFQVLIRPSTADDRNGTGMSSGNGSMTITRSTVFNALSVCYGVSPLRIITNSALPDGNFDYVAKTPAEGSDLPRTWLRQAVETTFGLSAKHETRNVTVFVLSAPRPLGEHLVPTVMTRRSSNSTSGPRGMWGNNQDVASIARSLEKRLRKPILDETGLTNHYDFDLTWSEASEDQATPETIQKAVREQLGLELTEATRPIEMLIVDKSVSANGVSGISAHPAQ